MNPRSLVGMTQGARKRAARRWYAALDGTHIADFGRRLDWYAERLAEARARYRIGERLRPCLTPGFRLPCPGCPDCNGGGLLPAKRAAR